MSSKILTCLGLILGLGLVPATARAEAAASPGINPASSPDQLREELYLKVFKHPPPKLPITGYVLVVIDGTSPQKVPAMLPPDGQQVLLEGRLVVALLSPLLRPDLVRQLEKKIDAEGRLNRAALEAAGLTVAFDPRRFELAINTPPEMRGTMVRDLSPPPPDPFSVDAVRPAGVSGFLNFNVKGTARSTTSGQTTRRQTDAAFATDGALNVRGVVLEGSAYGQRSSWERGDLRLVYDRPRQALRFTAGDLSYPVVGYQTMVSLLGLGVARDFALQPHVPTWRTNQFGFYLERPAEVKVWVNDSLVNTLQLPAGAHDIRGLNAAVGQNDVRLVIEDDAGRRDALQFSFIFNPVLLEQGRRVFSYNAGFLSEQKSGGYHYDLDQPVFSGSFLTGWTDETTLGAYAQADRARSLFGFKALHSFALGTLQLDTAASGSEFDPWDAGVWLELTGDSSSRHGHGGLQSQVAVEYLGRYFGPLPATTPASGPTLSVRASLAVPLGRGTTGQLTGSYTPARHPGTVDAYSTAATITRRWGPYVSGTVSLRHYRREPGRSETDLRFGLNISFSKGTANFYAAKELESDTVSASWESGRPSNGTAPYGFASTRVSSDNREYRAGAGYWGNHGLAELAHVRYEAEQGSGWSTRDETTVRLQGALVFADTRFALAQHVSENFVIVTGQHGLTNVAMRVDPDDRGGSLARSDWLSPAVLGDLSNYRLREVRIEPVNPPLGATPEKTTFTLAPTYKSGFLVKLGREPQLVALGRLVDELGKPLAHLAIEIHRLGQTGEKPVSTFTSRSGTFQLPDLKPGRYEIRTSGTTLRRGVTVNIPAAPDGLYRLGDVVLPAGT